MNPGEERFQKKIKKVNVLDKEILKLEGELRILKRRREAKMLMIMSKLR